MLPTVEQSDTVGESFSRGRVDARRARTVPSPALVIESRPDADLVVELSAETRPTNSLSRRTRREVSAAGGSRRGRGAP
ncbi:hypothetical protein JCM18899A_47220 [Nocardioides sp. AN3]